MIFGREPQISDRAAGIRIGIDDGKARKLFRCGGIFERIDFENACGKAAAGRRIPKAAQLRPLEQSQEWLVTKRRKKKKERRDSG
jgi:hypothetical protein